MGDGEGSTRKQGASRPRQWCKVHLGLAAETLEVRAIEGEQANATGPREPASGSRVGDGPMRPKLLEQIPSAEQIGPVTADGAYDTRSSHAALAARQACAVSPVRRNGRPWRETTPGAQARNDILRATQHLGRASVEDVERRSSATSGGLQDALPETAGRAPHGPHPRPPDRQTAELQIRAALLNRFTALGTPETRRVA